MTSMNTRIIPASCCPYTGEQLTLREIVLYSIAALCAYLAWIFFCLIRTRRHKLNVSGVDTPELGAVRSPPLGGDSLREYSTASEESHVQGNELDAFGTFKSQASEPDASAFGFDALLEMRQTRHRFDELQASHRRLEAIVSMLNDEVRGLRAACQVSPVYSEAVALARRGFNAAAIAERCGISVAEAELVTSLSLDDNGDKHGE
jgi:hypothetical protein